MPKATYHFPRGFLWGTASAAHQVEGDNLNNQWWAWEQAGHTAATSGRAADWWAGRWQEDFDRAAASGQNAQRISVEWSRIQPAPNRWDEDALERYREMLRGLHQRGLSPMVTLHHFTDPIWLTEIGSWETQAVIPLFEKFVRKTIQALKDFCSLWCTINEPSAYALNGYVAGGLSGDWPPGKNNLKLAMQVQANMLRAHVAAYHAIHQIQPEARVGAAMHYRSLVPHHKWSPLDKLLTKNASNLINDGFPMALSKGYIRTALGTQRIPEAIGTQDYFGFNYYTRNQVTFDVRKPNAFFSHGFHPQDADLSDSGFLANEPDGFYEGLKRVVRMFPNLPILVTENGFADAQDRVRPRYIAQHIHQMWRAVNFNWPIQGYFHWTLVDNFEWDHGWTQRFGLWALDPETQIRTKRPSADLYVDICKENGLSSEMVQKYCPEVFEKLFPS